MITKKIQIIKKQKHTKVARKNQPIEYGMPK